MNHTACRDGGGSRTYSCGERGIIRTVQDGAIRVLWVTSGFVAGLTLCACGGLTNDTAGEANDSADDACIRSTLEASIENVALSADPGGCDPQQGVFGASVSGSFSLRAMGHCTSAPTDRIDDIRFDIRSASNDRTSFLNLVATPTRTAFPVEVARKAVVVIEYESPGGTRTSYAYCPLVATARKPSGFMRTSFWLTVSSGSRASPFTSSHARDRRLPAHDPESRALGAPTAGALRRRSPWVCRANRLGGPRQRQSTRARLARPTRTTMGRFFQRDTGPRAA
jgi:hypothetical protein